MYVIPAADLDDLRPQVPFVPLTLCAIVAFMTVTLIMSVYEVRDGGRQRHKSAAGTTYTRR